MRQVQMSIWSFLHRSNITRQKMILVSKQRDDFQRAVYLQIPAKTRLGPIEGIVCGGLATVFGVSLLSQEGF